MQTYLVTVTIMEGNIHQYARYGLLKAQSAFAAGAMAAGLLEDYFAYDETTIVNFVGVLPIDEFDEEALERLNIAHFIERDA